MFLYALVAADSEFAVDIFVTDADARQALTEVLFDEPALTPLLSVVELPPPWAGCAKVALDPHPQ